MSQKRVLIEVSDIKGIEMECLEPKCQSRYFITIQQSNGVHGVRDKCPICGTKQFSKFGGPDHNAVLALVDALKALQVEEPEPLARIRLEISPEEQL